MDRQQWPEEEQGFYFPEEEMMIEPRHINIEPADNTKSQPKTLSMYRQVKPRLRLIFDRSMQQRATVLNDRYRLNKEDEQPISKQNNLQSHNSSCLPQTRHRSYARRKINREDIELTLQDDFVEQLLGSLQPDKPIHYVQRPIKSTFNYMKNIALSDSRSFLHSEYNKQIREKVERMPDNVQETSQENVQFSGYFESGNLSIVQEVSPNEYDLYIRIDTNTHGHQNWYSFKVKSKEKKAVKFNICNLQRQITLYPQGLKPYVSIDGGIWHPMGEGVSYTDSQMLDRKTYKLSFKLDLKANHEYEVSMLPKYTYSQLLNYIRELKDAKVQALGYTLSGLFIPLLTIGNEDDYEINKNVVLISGRVHPGETVASYIIHGILQSLTKLKKQENQLFKNTVFKIVPMLNPDGVVFGNFRTSLLGVDLNRSFNREEEILYPQVVALKRLGSQLKDRYRNRFSCFMDIHGHSTKRNIFTYGPDYPITAREYDICRLIPKLIENNCDIFKYSSCSFKLEECKVNTARGYFLRQLRVMAYTLQSSYGLYDQDRQVRHFELENWLMCGSAIVSALYQYLGHGVSLVTETIKINPQKTRLKLLKSLRLSLQQSQKQMLHYHKEHNSDSEDEDQDLTVKERTKIQKKLIMSMLPPVASNLPRMIEKHSIIYPLGTPDLSGEIRRDELRLKLIQHRKGSYMRITPAKRETIIKHLEKLAMIEPKSRNLKISFRD